MLKKQNKRNLSRYLRIGQQLIIPIKAKSSGAKVKSSKSRNSKYYRIRSGDTLYSISRKFKVRVKDLIVMNTSIKSRSSIIRSGTVIRVN